MLDSDNNGRSYALKDALRRIGDLENKYENLGKQFVRLERYLIIERGVIALFAVLAGLAVGAMWDVAIK